MSKRCGAKRRDGQPCRAWAMPNGRCRIHGGKTPRGFASPQTKHGRYSKDLPTRLAGKYHEAMQDPELLALRDDIALIDSRLSDILGRVDTGEAGAHWRRLRELWVTAKVSVEPADKIAALEALGHSIERGFSDYAVWGEIGGLIDQRRRLVESERKRLVDMQLLMTVPQAMLLMGAVTRIITDHVSDRNTLAAISAEFTKLSLEEGR